MRLGSLFFRGWNLRVVAHSDAPEDQRRKLAVRDAVLYTARTRPVSIRCIRRAARNIDATARVHLTLYPPRAPRPTLQVTLGQGHGQNWLGLLFPDAFGLPETGPVRFRWWLAELLKGWGWL